MTIMPRSTVVHRHVERPAVAPHGARQPRINIGSHVLAFGLGVLQCLQINAVGTFYVGELLAALVLGFILSKRQTSRVLFEQKRTLIFFGLWIFGQVVTDLYRDIPPEDFVRGWAKIVFTMMDFGVTWCIIRADHRNIFWLAVGLAIGMAGRFILFPDPLTASDPWKFVFGHAALLLAAAIGSTRWMRTFMGWIGGWLPLIVVGLISLLLNARSLFGIALLSGGYVVLAGLIARRPALAAKITPVAFALILLSGVVASQIMIAGYSFLAESGSLGVEAHDKYLSQSTGDLPLILGGRVETLVGIEAIKDSPILGHGSWVNDPHYLNIYFQKLAFYAVPYVGDPSQTYETIPSHSLIIGSWVDGGILGGLFWMWILIMSLKALYGTLKIPQLPQSIVALVIVINIWDIPFSPLPADGRMLKGFQIAVIMYVVQAISQYRLNAPRAPTAPAAMPARALLMKPVFPNRIVL